MWQDAKNIYHLFVAILANVWYGFPSRKLIVIGVTGTDGKTTTVNAIFHILQSSGLDVSMISTTGAVINGKDYDVGFHVTTPSSRKLQEFFKKSESSESAGRLSHVANDARQPIEDNLKSDPSSLSERRSPKSINNSDIKTGSAFSSFASEKPPIALKNNHYMVLELTSHALHQYRDWGINYEVGVLTNITNEHLDYHKTYENYVKAKSILLKRSKIAILNRDDRSYALLNLKFKIQNSKLLTYGLKNKADFTEKDLPPGLELAEFNKYNLLAATAACKSLGIDDEVIGKAVRSFQPPIGRGQIVYSKDFDVMIDFAHTPNGFEQLLSSIRPSVKGRIIHVFGSAGERDSKKRPEMGKISAKYADIVILTAEDPRSESLEKINEEIEKGIFNFQFSIFNEKQNFQFEKGKKYYFKINDRQQAINAAVKIAKKGDLVLLTGKAHEKSMNYGRGEVPWSEHEAVKKALKINNYEKD